MTLPDFTRELTQAQRLALSRRRVLKYGAALFGTAAIMPLLAACGDDDDDTPAVDPAPTDDDDDTEDVEPSDDDDEDDDDTAAPGDVVEGGTLNYALSAEPGNLDPNSAQAWFEASVFELIHDPLIRVGLDATYVPSLVESWESAEDGLTYTFHCREDVTFHDGAPFNAEAVQFHFDRVLAPETRSAAAAPLLGGNVDSVTVVDEFTADIHLNSIFPGFLDACSSPYSSVNSPQAVEEFGEDIAQNPVGSGPFIFDEWVPRERIRLVKNPDYNWGAVDLLGRSGPAYLDEIIIRPIEEATVLTGALERGEVDMVFMLPPTEYEYVNDLDHLRVERMLRPGTCSMLMLNASNPPTDDILVRQALIHAIDYEEINFLVYGGQEVEPTSIWAAGMLENREDFHWRDVYPLDLERAEELLDEAGWEMNETTGYREKDGVRLEVDNICFPGAACQEAEVQQAQLRNVGVHLNVRELGQPANIDATQAGEHHLRPIGWSGRDTSLLADYLFHPDNAGTGWNFTFHNDAELTELVEEIGRELDFERRIDLAAQIEDRVFELAIALPRSEYARDAGLAQEVQGMLWNMSNAHPNLTNVYLTD
jgi:peptide/nickel transport system substrate-binding protein